MANKATNKAVKELHLDESKARALSGFLRKFGKKFKDKEEVSAEIERLIGRIADRKKGDGKELHLREASVDVLKAVLKAHRKESQNAEILDGIYESLTRANMYVQGSDGRRHTIRKDLTAAA